MLKPKSAKRYAKAFYELALESNQLEGQLKDFQLVSKTITNSSQLRAVLSVPMISNQKRSEIIESIFSTKINKKSLKCIQFLIHKNRSAIIADVFVDLTNLYNSYNNIKEVKIFSAFELSKNNIKALKKKIMAKIDKKILMQIQVVPELVGGFKIIIDDQVYDFSVLSQLNELKNNLINLG